MALSHARIASSRTSVRTSVRRQRGRGLTTAAGRVKSTTQIHAVDVVVTLGAASPKSGGDGATRVSAGGAGAVAGAATTTGSSIGGRIPGWASATTAAQHNVRTRKTPHEIGVTVARNCRRRLRKPSTALTVDHCAPRCQTSVAQWESRRRKALRCAELAARTRAGSSPACAAAEEASDVHAPADAHLPGVRVDGLSPDQERDPRVGGLRTRLVVAWIAQTNRAIPQVQRDYGFEVGQPGTPDRATTAPPSPGRNGDVRRKGSTGARQRDSHQQRRAAPSEGASPRPAALRSCRDLAARDHVWRCSRGCSHAPPSPPTDRRSQRPPAHHLSAGVTS